MRRDRLCGALALAALAVLVSCAWWSGASPLASDEGGHTAGEFESASSLPTTLAPLNVDDLPQVATGGNPADFYRNAFVLYQRLSKVEQEALELGKVLDEAEAEVLFAKLQPIMDLLRQAAASGAPCDWGVELSITAPMGHHSDVLKIAKVGRWMIDYQFHEDDAEAVDDLSVLTQLAQSVGEQLMVGSLIGTAVNSYALGVLRVNSGWMDNARLTQALRMLDSGWEGTVAIAVQNESAALLRFNDSFPDADARDKAILAFEVPKGEGRLTPVQLTNSREQLAWLAQVEQAVAERIILPDDAYQQWWTGIKAEGANRPIAEKTLRSIELVLDSVRYYLLQRAMISAGLQISHGGGGFPNMADGMGGGSFTYRRIKGGFELRSNYKRKGNAVVMNFAMTKAP